MPTNNDDIRALLKADQPDMSTPDDQRIVTGAMLRVRSTVARKDTLTFALIKVWTVLAQLLAPLFARLAVSQARAARRNPTSTNTSNPT